MVKNYEYLFEVFPPEKIESRVDTIYKATIKFLTATCTSFKNNFKDGPKINYEDYFYISGTHVQQAVIDYFADIYRLKEFHEIPKVNNFKIAAYQAYWLHKRHPIQYVRKLPDEVLKKFEKFRFINESLAVFIMLNFVFDMKVHHVVGIDAPSNVPRFQRELMYNFIYRRVTPQELELILSALFTTYPHPPLNNANI